MILFNFKRILRSSSFNLTASSCYWIAYAECGCSVSLARALRLLHITSKLNWREKYTRIQCIFSSAQFFRARSTTTRTIYNKEEVVHANYTHISNTLKLVNLSPYWKSFTTSIKFARNNKCFIAFFALYSFDYRLRPLHKMDVSYRTNGLFMQFD